MYDTYYMFNVEQCRYSCILIKIMMSIMTDDCNNDNNNDIMYIMYNNV